MKVEVSCFVGGMVIKEIVHVDKFEDADKVAKSRNPFCRVVNRKVLMKWLVSSMSIPPHFIDEKNKEVVFHIKGGHPITMAIPTWMKSFQMTTRVFLVAVKKLSISWGQKSMTEKVDWKQELLDSAKFNKKHENLLKNGAKSLTDSWLLVAWRSI